MRIGPLLACAASVVLAASLVVPAVADTVPPPTLYVTGEVSGHGPCSDGWPGTYSQPLCTIQAAADIVVPGQTVIVDPNAVDPYATNFENIAGDIHITRSGTPSAPIVFTTGHMAPSDPPQETPVAIVSGTNGFTLDGVHDVTIQGFAISGTSGDGIVVSNSSDITIDNANIELFSPPAGHDGVDISGTSSNVTVGRSLFDGDGSGIAVGPGVSATDVVDNIFYGGDYPNVVSIDGAANTDITNNTLSVGLCPVTAFSVVGGATGTSIENNIEVDYNCASTSAPLLTVAADSAAGTRSDYNVVYAKGDNGIYSWGGTLYGSAAALDAATGQGAHDLNAYQSMGDNDAPENGPAIDSADASAPGILATDYNGNRRRVDDPSVANTGTGVGYVDRGAVELQDPMTLFVSTNTTRAPTGGTVVVSISALVGWAAVTGYTVDFGDGSAPVISTSPHISHVYSAISDAPYQITVTVTDSLGNIATSITQLDDSITVVSPAPLVPILSVGRAEPPSSGAYYADASNSTDSWSLAGATCDFGDGTTAEQSPNAGCLHVYAAVGIYRVTVTIADADGNTATTSRLLDAGPLPVVKPTLVGGHCASCR